MPEDKREQEHNEPKKLDEADLEKDLEIKEAKDADAVKGGSLSWGITGSGTGKV